MITQRTGTVSSSQSKAFAIKAYKQLQQTQPIIQAITIKNIFILFNLL
ncbi:hypothetical protein [Methanobrevibacter sp.]